jgi:Bacteriophage HK97-gp10, putative tail-component
MPAATRIEVDDTKFRYDVNRLQAGIRNVARDTPKDNAEEVARRLRALVPVRTGRLRASVDVVDVYGGAGVTYGSGLPYATYIDHRTGCVDDATQGVERRYADDCERAAAREVSKL